MLTSAARRAMRRLAVLTAAFCGALLPFAASGVAAADQVRNAQLWVLNALDVPNAWQISQGRGVLVAVIDSGVNPAVSDLAGSVASGPDFTGVGTPRTNPGWGQHGTWMASLIAGHGHGPQGMAGIRGIAPQARILSIRVITDRSDPGYTAYQAQPPGRGQHELARAIMLAVVRGARVISMSLGYNAPSRAVRAALQYALNHNVVVVASSGNSGNSQEAQGQGHAPYSFPADYPGVLGVAAINQSGSPAYFSSENLSVEVAAPGVNVPAQGRDGKYWLVSGTSPACALIAGVAALIRSANPQLTAAQVRRAITSTTTHRPPRGYDDTVGFGTVDADAALHAAKELARQIPAGNSRAAKTIASGYFGGGPRAVPAVPVPPRGSGVLLAWCALAAGCLLVVIISARRLLVPPRPAAATAVPQPAAGLPGWNQPPGGLGAMAAGSPYPQPGAPGPAAALWAPPQGYPGQPPAAQGYPGQPPAAQGYPGQPPAAQGYPGQPPAAQGYPGQPPAVQGYPGQALPPGTARQPLAAPGHAVGRPGYPGQPPIYGAAGPPPAAPAQPFPVQGQAGQPPVGPVSQGQPAVSHGSPGSAFPAQGAPPHAQGAQFPAQGQPGQPYMPPGRAGQPFAATDPTVLRGQPGMVPPGGHPAAGQAHPGQLGAGQPWPGQPGVVQPGPGQPGVVQPGPGQPGGVQPGAGQPPGPQAAGFPGQHPPVRPPGMPPGMFAGGRPSGQQPGGRTPGQTEAMPRPVRGPAGQRTPSPVYRGEALPSAAGDDQPPRPRWPGSPQPGLVPGEPQVRGGAGSPRADAAPPPAAHSPGPVSGDRQPGSPQVPSTSQPDAEPAQAQPAQAQPAEAPRTQAAEAPQAQPAQAQPAQAQAAQPQPAQAQPAEAPQAQPAQPQAAQPQAAQPQAAQPQAAQPQAAQPQAAQPQAAQPPAAQAQPADEASPPAAEPAEPPTAPRWDPWRPVKPATTPGRRPEGQP